MNVFIAGITSDIGSFLCNKYFNEGYSVYGTYRSTPNDGIKREVDKSGGKLFVYDFNSHDDMKFIIDYFVGNNIEWHVFISAVGIMSPIDYFENVNFKEWEDNIYTNAVSQLKILHELLPFRAKNEYVPTAFFMTSKGINDTFPRHSAYCLSKVFLVKACELLDDEIKDTKFVAFNPSFIRTKIILQENVDLNKNDSESDYYIAMNRVWSFIAWASKSDKRIVSGKNFFIKYDDWGTEDFNNFMLTETDAYKLRRNKDSWND